MTKWLKSGKGRLFLLSFAAGAALLLASLTNFLNHNEYPYFRWEVGLVAFGLLTLSAAIGLFYVGQRQWVRSVLEGLLAAVFLDLNTDSMALASAVGLAVGLLTAWRRFSLIGQMAVMGSVVMITTMLGLGGTPKWIKREMGAQQGKLANPTPRNPAIVHLILDEHIGLEGLSAEGVEGRQLRDELRAFYLHAGFAVYGRAYSRHFHTGNAIPEILNYGGRLARRASKTHVETGPTVHLKRLVDQGYALTIFQSEYVDYCSGAKFHECITYNSGSLQPTLSAPLDLSARVGLLTSKFLALSDIFISASNGWNALARLSHKAGMSPPMFNVNAARSNSVATLEAMDDLIERVRSIDAGEAIFAHLLVPHYPYVVRPDCTYLPWGKWDDIYSDSPIQTRRRKSYDQVRCTMRRIAEMLSALSHSPAGSNSIVIIHGDHGSRITHVRPDDVNFGKLSDSDMLAGFSTLFVVRGPSVRADYFGEPQPVYVLLHDFSASGFRIAPHPFPLEMPSVFLADRNWRPVRRVPLPTSWTKAH